MIIEFGFEFSSSKPIKSNAQFADPEIFHSFLTAVVNHVISHQSLSLVSPSIQVHSVDKGRTISKVI